ncbi:MurR/RpiR family transcriptional regulator [Paenibacillus sp. UNC451MF]|uniref:MurR/RpiR family transcriptional regulator n=1 Tax=Paenibacillus sp. UNC451MF TaxID=1449063 RepID=UPI00048B917A|nr:MurR/RpiR family transcriptional regulator [Paenibacillus sp. UNC451MF]
MKTLHEAGNTLLSIRSYLNAMTKTETVVAQYVLEHPEKVIYQSVTDVAEQADVGETTVLRFCRKLGFKGFQDFKLLLAQDLVQPVTHTHEEVKSGDAPSVLAHKIIATHSRILEETGQLLDGHKLSQAIELMALAESIQFYGVGSSGLTALQAAHAFTRIGKRCDARQDTHFQAMAASLLSSNDVAVGISVSGSTKDTIENLRLAKEAGAKILCITHNARSPITKLADVELLMAARENPLQGSSMAAKISQLTVIDILYAGVSLQMGDAARKYQERTAKAVSEKLY